MTPALYDDRVPETAATPPPSHHCLQLPIPASLLPYKRLRCGTDNVRERRPGNIKRASHLLRDKPGLLWHDLELIVLVCVPCFAPERKLEKKNKTKTPWWQHTVDLSRCAQSPNELSPIRLSGTNPPSSRLPLRHTRLENKCQVRINALQATQSRLMNRRTG